MIVTFLKKKKSKLDHLDRKRCFGNFCHAKWQMLFYRYLSGQLPFQTSNPFSTRLCFLVYDSPNQNQQTELFKKGVNATTERKKWASATLVLMANLPTYQKTYLLCTGTISLGKSVAVKKPKISQYFEKPLKIATRAIFALTPSIVVRYRICRCKVVGVLFSCYSKFVFFRQSTLKIPGLAVV